MRFPLILQYNNLGHMDGVGAQALRILGIYGVSNRFRFRYIHKGILACENKEELTGPIFSQKEYESVLKEVNDLLSLPSDRLPKSFFSITVDCTHLSRKNLFKYFLLSLVLRPLFISLFINVTLPFGVSNYMADPFSAATKRIRAKIPSSERNFRPQNVLHFRTVLHSKDDSRPVLSSTYYLDTLSNFAQQKSKVLSPLTVHCDIYPDVLQNSPDNPRVKDFLHFCEEAKHLDLKIKPYAPFFDTLYDFVFSETFFMGRSALSYLGALLSSGTVIYPPTHGHPKLPEWQMGNSSISSTKKFTDDSPI